MSRGRNRGWRRSLTVMLLLGCVAAVAACALALAPVASAASCGLVPNYYAGAYKNSFDQYGARGYIKSVNLSVPQENLNFSDQSFHGVEGTAGIEVGWYIGWGAETQTYVISPHAYATLNGDSEQDGPAVGQTTAWYSTNWNGSTQVWSVHATHGGTPIWPSGGGSLSQPAENSGPGKIWGWGEVNHPTLPMSGEFSGDSGPLELYDGSAWHNWPSITLCADSGFSSSGNVDDYSDSNN